MKEAGDEIREAMADAVKLDVPLVVDVGLGARTGRRRTDRGTATFTPGPPGECRDALEVPRDALEVPRDALQEE